MESIRTTRHLDVVYAEREQVPLCLDIVRPDHHDRLPVLLVVHGGGWCAGGRPDETAMSDYFAQAGYVVFNVDYRLAPAYPFPAAVEDVRAAADWVVANAAEFGGDAARLGAFGPSAGGHLVSLLATAPDTPLTCGVSFAGPMELRREDFTRAYRGYVLAFIGSCVHDAPELYATASPIEHLTAKMAPLLLIQGTEDLLVPAEQARLAAQAAQRVRAPFEVVFAEGVGHGFDLQDPVTGPALQRMMAFLNLHLASASS